jgi:glycosyltransferase involved in cell wall biosynthesis
MPPLRVCQLITELRPAGAERCVYELATRLDRSRFDVRVIALRGGTVEDALRQAGVETAVLNVRSKWDFLKVRDLADLLRRWRPDVLHTHLFHADLAGRFAARLAGVPHVVHTVHVAERRFRPWQFAWANLAAGWCDRIVAVSRDVAEFHAERSGLPRSAYTVIPNGIDVAAYARDEIARNRLRSQWSVGDDHVVAAFVGRLDRQKGVDTLLRAVGKLSPRRPGLRLVIAGEGPLRNELESLIAELRLGSCVQMLGFVQDVRAVLSAADVFVLPSRWEGFGLAAAEAMAAGLPVIAGRAAGLRELVEEGRTGLLVDADDASDIAQAIDRMLVSSSDRASMGSAGARRVEDSFKIERNVTRHEELYDEIQLQKKSLAGQVF